LELRRGGGERVTGGRLRSLGERRAASVLCPLAVLGSLPFCGWNRRHRGRPTESAAMAAWGAASTTLPGCTAGGGWGRPRHPAPAARRVVATGCIVVSGRPPERFFGSIHGGEHAGGLRSKVSWSFRWKFVFRITEEDANSMIIFIVCKTNR
jgi:hypothetical protein